MKAAVERETGVNRRPWADFLQMSGRFPLMLFLRRMVMSNSVEIIRLQLLIQYLMLIKHLMCSLLEQEAIVATSSGGKTFKTWHYIIYHRYNNSCWTWTTILQGFSYQYSMWLVSVHNNILSPSYGVLAINTWTISQNHWYYTSRCQEWFAFHRN